MMDKFSWMLIIGVIVVLPFAILASQKVTCNVVETKISGYTDGKLHFKYKDNYWMNDQKIRSEIVLTRNEMANLTICYTKDRGLWVENATKTGIFNQDYAIFPTTK